VLRVFNSESISVIQNPVNVLLLLLTFDILLQVLSSDMGTARRWRIYWLLEKQPLLETLDAINIGSLPATSHAARVL
jgi:hypothetical protein